MKIYPQANGEVIVVHKFSEPFNASAITAEFLGRAIYRFDREINERYKLTNGMTLEEFEKQVKSEAA